MIIIATLMTIVIITVAGAEQQLTTRVDRRKISSLRKATSGFRLAIYAAAKVGHVVAVSGYEDAFMSSVQSELSLVEDILADLHIGNVDKER